MSGEIARLHELYRAGHARPADVLDEHLARARAVAARGFAFTALYPERAQAEARASEARFARGAPRSLLDGVPVTVQDLLPVRGDGEDGAAEAVVVGRLRTLGAVLVGKTRLSQYGDGHGSYASVQNPWAHDDGAGVDDAERGGGGAATVAMGVGFASLGLDACGSMRNPAAWCGTVGFKPTQGALPTEGAVPLSPTLDHMAILARRVEDARIVLEALVSGGRRRALRPSPAPLRVGTIMPDGLCPDVMACCEEVLGLLAHEGAEVTPVEGLPLRPASAAAIALMYAEVIEMHGPRLARHWHGYSPTMRTRALAGSVVTGADYVRARAVRDALKDEWPGLLAGAGVDLVALPTVPCGAPPEARLSLHGGDLPDAVLSTSPFDLLGVPAVTVPIGRDEDGLPVGLQIVGLCGDDHRVLAAAARVEAVRGFWPAPPGFTDPLSLATAR